jgi:hypothetical protein
LVLHLLMICSTSKPPQDSVIKAVLTFDLAIIDTCPFHASQGIKAAGPDAQSLPALTYVITTNDALPFRLHSTHRSYLAGR